MGQPDWIGISHGLNGYVAEINLSISYNNFWYSGGFVEVSECTVLWPCANMAHPVIPGKNGINGLIYRNFGFFCSKTGFCWIFNREQDFQMDNWEELCLHHAQTHFLLRYCPYLEVSPLKLAWATRSKSEKIQHFCFTMGVLFLVVFLCLSCHHMALTWKHCVPPRKFASV